MTLDGQVLGTPAYMSPEQSKGEAHHVEQLAQVLLCSNEILFVD